MAVWQGKMVRNLAHYDVVPDVHSGAGTDGITMHVYIFRSAFTVGYLLVDFYCIGSPAVVLYNKTVGIIILSNWVRKAGINKTNPC